MKELSNYVGCAKVWKVSTEKTEYVQCTLIYMIDFG